MDTPVASSGYFKVFLAAQVRMKDKGFLSRDISVSDLIAYKGDVHHVFSRGYLKKHGVRRKRYNQIANYVMMQSEINIQLGDRPPAEYFSALLDACRRGKAAYGAICDADELQRNLAAHCIPPGIEHMTVADYDGFLDQRRNLMAGKMREYYAGL
jgi:hypothetical protein